MCQQRCQQHVFPALVDTVITESIAAVLLAGPILVFVLSAAFLPVPAAFASTETSGFVLAPGHRVVDVSVDQEPADSGFVQDGVNDGINVVRDDIRDGIVVDTGVGVQYASFLDRPGVDLSDLNTMQYTQGVAGVTVAVVPEPASLGFVAVGTLALTACRRRCRLKKSC